MTVREPDWNRLTELSNEADALIAADRWTMAEYRRIVKAASQAANGFGEVLEMFYNLRSFARSGGWTTRVLGEDDETMPAEALTEERMVAAGLSPTEAAARMATTRRGGCCVEVDPKAAGASGDTGEPATLLTLDRNDLEGALAVYRRALAAGAPPHALLGMEHSLCMMQDDPHALLREIDKLRPAAAEQRSSGGGVVAGLSIDLPCTCMKCGADRELPGKGEASQVLAGADDAEMLLEVDDTCTTCGSRWLRVRIDVGMR